MFGLFKKETQKTLAYEDTRRVLYVKKNCPFCKAALAALRRIENSYYIPHAKRIEVKWIDESDSAIREELSVLSNMGVKQDASPVLLYEGIVIAGCYTSRQYEMLLLKLFFG